MVIAKNKKEKQFMNNTKTMENNRPGPEPPNNPGSGVPVAVFIPHANSLPFEERRVTLEEPVKIGRNVYKATPTPTNTIFECRVLSRHHATLYYDKGQFYLLDNQSSNGTFINNNRCSISDDQEPHEVFSGDIVQFGISVIENNTNAEKNTFPPVVAQLKLYHPDGKEAKLAFNPTMTTPLHLKELYQLNNFLQEAVEREASLESRLHTLRECVERTRSEAQSSWELFVGEQRLLMRVHALENMLAVGKQPELQHVAQLLDDKRNYQEVAQESLRAAHEQRLALEESLERRSREAAALHHHNCALRLAANNALQELQKLAARCERKMCAARLAIAAAEEREAAIRAQLPLTYSVQNGEAKMLVLSTDCKGGGEGKRGSLEEAVKALPDYIKLLLPQHLLNKVGIKAVSADGKTSKEFELILQNNDAYDEEVNEKQLESEGESGNGEEKSLSETAAADLCTDDEKQSRLNHDTDVEPTSGMDGETMADNNANSTYTDSADTDDSPSKTPPEMAGILRVMSGLNEEIRALRERVAAADAASAALRGVRDELLASRDVAATPVHEHDCQAAIAELQAQVSRGAAAEEANLAEIQRLASSAASMQAELAFRPTRADVDDLAAVIAKLQADLLDKNALIKQLQSNDEKKLHDKATETSRSLEDLRDTDDPDSSEIDAGKISEKIDEMFQLDYEDDDEETDSVSTELVAPTKTDAGGESGESGAEYVKLDDGQRLQLTLSNGSLHALEEELVRAKEKWAEEAAERARLAAKLAACHSSSKHNLTQIILFFVPVVVALACWIFLPQIS